MPETTIKFTTDAKGAITGIEQLGKSLGNLDKTAQQASKGGLKGFTTGLADMKAGFDVLSGSLSGVIQFGAELNRLGTESRQLRESLDAVSGGKAVDYLNQMRAGVKGLVPDTALAQSAVKAMTLDVATNGQQLAQLAKAGAILGKTMGYDAAVGVDTLTVALTRVNQIMLLDNIGLNAEKIRKRFEELRLTMSDQQAWSTAVLEGATEKAKLLEGSLDGAGSGVKRLENAFTALKTSAGENISYLIDQTIALTDAMGKAGVSFDMGNMLGWLGKMDDIRNKVNQSNMSNPSVPGMPGNGTDNVSLASPEYTAMQADIVRAKLEVQVQQEVTKWLHRLDSVVSENRQMRSDMAKRNAYRNIASPWDTLGGNVKDAGGNANAGMFGALGKQFALASQMPEAMKTLNKILEGGKALFDPYAQGLNKVAAAWENMSEVQRRAQSKAAAFGTTGGGIFGEIGGDMGSLFDQRRETYKKELEKQFGANYKKLNEGIAALNKQYGGNTKDPGYQKGLRGLYGRYGANTTAINKGMESYDKDTKSAMDAYKLATGQATKASLAFDDQLASLQKKFLDGKIDAKTYAKELRDLGTAASVAGGDFDKFLIATGRSAEGVSTGPKDKAGTGAKWGTYSPPKPGAYTGPQKIGQNSTREEFDVTKDSPFASLQKGLGELDNGFKNITDKTAAIPGVAESAFATAADKVKPYQKVIDTLNSTINQSLALRAGVRITYETLWTGGGQTGGGSGGRKF